jgi:bacillithiol biosynthesis cysteine-adding enzyme BshC
MDSFCNYINTSYVPLEDTGYFSRLLIDYLNNHPALSDKYQFRPDDDGLRKAIIERQNFDINRLALTSVIKKQYTHLNILTTEVENQIELLKSSNTFTVCTAHQPNLGTGYAYFVYKIMHTVVLCDHLKTQHPSYNFIPVFYIGSEDDDLDELGFFRFGENDFRWNTNQTGAVGRMHTHDLQPLLQSFFNIIGPPNDNSAYIKDLFSKAYHNNHTIAEATQYIVHQLFGKFGVIALNPDEHVLKNEFKSVLKAELFTPRAYDIIQNTNKDFEQHYKTQAHARPINLFYLKEDIRSRIEKVGENWRVVNTNIVWSKTELENEVENYPERFSPNVILRGLYQETILPNVAFIGGGSEIAYWLQLKNIFNSYNVFYPTIIPRQSIQFLEVQKLEQIEKLGLTFAILSKNDEAYLVKNRVHELTQNDLSATQEWLAIQTALQQIKQKAVKVDANLNQSIEAALKKIKYQIDIVERKIYKAEKKNLSIEVNKIYKLKHDIFPHQHLQERYYTFMEEFVIFGDAYWNIVKNSIKPYGDEFAIITYN